MNSFQFLKTPHSLAACYSFYLSICQRYKTWCPSSTHSRNAPWIRYTIDKIILSLVSISISSCNGLCSFLVLAISLRGKIGAEPMILVKKTNKLIGFWRLQKNHPNWLVFLSKIIGSNQQNFPKKANLMVPETIEIVTKNIGLKPPFLAFIKPKRVVF